jgi:penicillin-binding protein 2
MSSQSTNRYQVEPWRVWLVYGVIILVIVALIYRLVSLQIFSAQSWLEQAVENYQTTISEPAARGIIYDRNGFILARNIASYNVVITPAGLPDDEADIQRIYREVSELTGVPPGGPVTPESLNNAKLFSVCVPGPSIADMVALGESLAPFTPVRITCNISEALARIIREKTVDWPGVSLEIEPIRDYPTGSLTANIIGFLGPIPAAFEADYRDRGFIPNRDKIGYAGIETSLDDILLGINGTRVAQVDVAGQELRNLEPPIPSVPGNNVVLTIDTRLQKAAEAALVDEINFWNTFFGTTRISSGVVIAMNPKTGEILAMVSYPTFENNRMARFIPGYYYEQLSQDPRTPLVNNAVSAELAPGSTFKLSTATGAFNEGVVDAGDIIETPGRLVLCERFSPNDPCVEGRNTRPFVDWIYERNGVINEAGFGSLDFFRCIAFSSNVCFYKLGGGYEDEIEEGLGIFRLGEYARALGYGARSGIQLPGEEDGLVPSPQWKRINTGENWSTGDTYIASVGQGYVTGTPLQVLMSGATIANRGKLMQPTVVREVQDGEGRVMSMWFDPVNFTVYELRQTTDARGNVQDVWVNPIHPTDSFSSPPPGSYQISPFTPNMKWDVTVMPLINEWSCLEGYCDLTGNVKTIQPATIEAVRNGTRMAVTQDLGTLHDIFIEAFPIPVAIAGKTGTAEYCDDVARQADRCRFGAWPTHAWTLAYAPFDDPEIIILAFAYNGGEGGSVAAPIVARVMQAYFELKSIDLQQNGGG